MSPALAALIASALNDLKKPMPVVQPHRAMKEKAND